MRSRFHRRMSSWSISVLLLWLMGCAQHARVPVERSPSAGGERPVASMPKAAPSTTRVDPSPSAPLTSASPVQTPTAPVAAAARRVDVKDCQATLWLHDTPAYFEGAAVAQLHHLHVDVAANPNVLVTLDAPAFDAVRLPPRFALRLPHGPAIDAPARRTGLLHDLPTVVLVGILNLAFSPLLLPLSMVLDPLHPDGAFIPLPKAPTHAMFSVALLDEVHFNAEVQRRAEPHRAVLEQEQQRQQRFAEWLVTPQQSPQERQCQTDAQGHCQLSLWWPKDAITFHLGPEGCQQPQQAPTAPSAPTTPKPTPKPVDLFVQLTPARVPAPSVLAVPPTNDTRGAGAQATAEAWARDNGVNWLNSEGKALFARAPQRGSLQTGDTLVCRIRVRGDMDGDGSPPEVLAHFVFGGITDFAERGFEAEMGWQRFIVLPAIDLRAGDLVKLSVAEADVFDDDWIGMDLVTWDGRLPLRFSHRHFDAECRAASA